MKKDDDRPISNRFTYVITFLLGLAFSITLMQSAWKTGIERKQKDFHFEILSIQQAVASNVLTGNDVTNNVAAFISSNDDVLSNQFDTFTKDVLARYKHIEAINYYSFTGDDWVNEFRLVYESARNSNRIKINDDIYSDPKYIDAVDTAIVTGSVVPAPPDIETDPDRKYWLFKAIYSQGSPLSVKKKHYAGIVKGMVSVLVSPTKLLGDMGANSSLTITMFSDTSNLYGRQLLYFNDPEQDDANKFWKVETLTEEKLIQLPPYSIKIIIEKDLYFSDLEHHLLLVSLLISVGILMMLFGLVRARIKQEEELKIRNAVIEQKVEEQTYELAIARDSALEAVRMKSEFLASMSHEIRTPLNAIIGMSDLMSETQLSSEQSRYVNVFRKAGDALLSLVNDILDLSKIEADQLSLEEISFNILDLIEEEAEIYALKAADKDIEIITQVDTGINVFRVGDPSRLKQIILNLISNALKFTEQGEIIVSLTADTDSEAEGQLLITISDTGIGIAKDKLESIFVSFTQADTSTTRKYGGTGLGLTISKRLTEMMQGKIWVDSIEGKGSDFHVSVNLPELSKQSKISQDFLHKNILIIDSRISNCNSIAKQLVAAGASCHQATSLVEAQTLLTNQASIDAVLIDSRLALLDKQINPWLKETMGPDNVVLLVNPKDANEHLAQAQLNKVNNILLKPVKRSELFKVLNNVINDADETTIQLTRKELEAEVVTPRHILLVEDNPDNRMLIKAYLKKTPHTLDEAENGAVAVEMRKQTDYDLVFMDVQMPVMDGHEATRLIREWEEKESKQRTVIISLTAHAIREEIEKCLASGCDSHLSKPIKKATLLHTINTLGA